MYALVNTLPPIDGEGHGVLAPGVDGHFLDDVLRQRRDLPRRRDVVGVSKSESAVGALTAGVNAPLLRSFAITEYLNGTRIKCINRWPLPRKYVQDVFISVT